MRAKRRRLAPRPREPQPAALPTAQWLLEAEVGWGLPHAILALPGLAVLGIHAVQTAVARRRVRRRP